jgi:hypothetical protein
MLSHALTRSSRRETLAVNGKIALEVVWNGEGGGMRIEAREAVDWTSMPRTM